MDTWLKDDECYETVSGLTQPRVMVFRPDFLVLLRAVSLRLRIVVKEFGHGTEIMKLCQEIVCPMYRFEYDATCI